MTVTATEPPEALEARAWLDWLEALPGAMLGLPADADDLDEVMEALIAENLPLPPAAWTDLLAAADGAMWNGLQLFGVTALADPITGFTLPDLVDANLEEPQADTTLLLGQRDGERLVFRWADRRYAVVGRSGGDERLSGTDPIAILTAWIGGP